MIMCCLVTFALEPITHHVLKRRYEALSREHMVRSYFVTSKKLCDSHNEISLCIINIVVVLIDVCGDRWPTWLPEVCNHDLPVLLLAFVEQSIFQVW